MSLSARGAALAGQPGHGLPTEHTFDRDTNPDGLIAPAYAINIPIKREHFHFDWPANGGPGLRAALATHFNDNFHPHVPVLPEHIIIGEGATSIVEILAFALMGPGDGVLMSRPAYAGYKKDFAKRANVKICWVETSAEESLDPQALIAAYEKALARSHEQGIAIKAVLITNPNNPLGRCYPRATQLAIMAFCHAHNLHLISDEIFGATEFSSHLSPSPSSPGSTADRTPFTSILSIPQSSTQLSLSRRHVIYGLAKDFGAPGLRIGALVSQSNPELLSSAHEMLRFHDVSGPSVAIATAMLEDREWCKAHLDKTRRGLARAYEHATRGLEELGIEYVKGGCAGFFVFLDLSPFLPLVDEGSDLKTQTEEEGPSAAEVALVRKLVDHGLYLAPRGESYGKPGWFRFVFSHEPHVIDEALRRLKKVIAP
ncbi:pyridoxal phosphate-dependent transferase [Microdochium trichocladiopsis]|uniref:Pyridoxal phosphate-dependent transferase n=1 Tax=Microdochium trichocladiopsis TaxID=1682393 RepID=A0A9P8YJ75_9PEZI|nr:pyridoxal phosphate-dependent transferase [Microdochium trichocladiopsis]KAH7041496.1 pyridoxal phosphate-dependent transferase [Microdochium trichocladiopsis]